MNSNVRLPENFLESSAAPVMPPPAASAGKLQRPIDMSIQATRTQNWGWLPALSLVGAVGLLLVAIADTLSRSGAGQYDVLLWIGVLILIVPAGARLASSEPSRRERIGLVVMVGLGLYLVKVMQSPYEFIFSDELVHSYNVNRILQTGALFNTNPILQVTPLYPGLETLTAALASLTGLSIFGAGLVVVGVARLILMLALYLFYEEVGGSARLAGIATLLYTTNANFLFWSAQFSYESLALPLAAFVMYVAMRRTSSRKDGRHFGLTALAVLSITAVVITHHLTSYFLAAFFIAWTLILLILRLWSRRHASVTSPESQRDSEGFTPVRSFAEPAALAVFTTIACLVWLVTVASYTVSYLSPVFSSAVNSIVNIIAGEASTRQLFQSTSGYVAPLWERLTGIGSVLLMLLATPIGLRKIWQNFRRHPIVLMLAVAALAYFAMLSLRLSPEAWETGNRASEFLFVGLSFVLAFAVVEVWNFRRSPWLGRAIVLGSLAVLFVGGVIAGWTPSLRLGKPLQVAVGNITIEPQGFAAAQWMRAALGPNNTVAADESNARLMLAYGEQQTLTGRYPDIKDLLGTSDIPNWQVELMQEWSIQYVVVDRRLISWDNMQGYYFDDTSNGPLASTDLFDPKISGKFDKPANISRIFDSGNIVIYDTKAISHATPVK